MFTAKLSPKSNQFACDDVVVVTIKDDDGELDLRNVVELCSAMSFDVWYLFLCNTLALSPSVSLSHKHTRTCVSGPSQFGRGPLSHQ